MRSEQTAKDAPRNNSLTDQILTFCASGRFGVREAIAAARMGQEKAEEPNTSGQAKQGEQKTPSP